MDSRYLLDKEELKSTPDKIDEDRRALLTTGLVGGAVAAAALASSVAQAQVTPVAATMAPFWPHPKWGKDDVAGASNWITPTKVLETAKWIKDGKIYRIGRAYETAMPKFGDRVFVLRIPGAPTGGPYGTNKMVYNDEFLSTEIGQTGTQFDGLGHIGIQMGKDGDKSAMHFYNGHTAQDINNPYGLAKLGIENCKPLFTRAHLIDVEGLKGQAWDVGQEIMVADVRAALQKQNMQETDIKEGDAVFFNTGFGKLWMKNNDKFNSGEPGIGLEVAKWLIDKNICVTGADTWATEVVPNPNKDLQFVVHCELIPKNGIYNHENLDFTGVIADKKYQFVYVFSPAPIKGATGSNGGPIAMT